MGSETELVQVHVRVSRDLLQTVDNVRGDLSRAAYVRRSLRTQLKADFQIREVLQAVVEEVRL